MKRTGECKRCGICCRIALRATAQAGRDNALVEWACVRELEMESGADGLTSIYAIQPCPRLAEGEDGMAMCTIYDYRPQLCREYPGDAGMITAGCGFRFEEV